MTAPRRLQSVSASKSAAFLLLVVLLGLSAYIFVFREQYYASAALKRSAGENAWLDRGFTVAIVWPKRRPGEHSLREGAELALTHINKRGGAAAGKITLRFYDEVEHDQGAVARAVVARDDVIAVIGHELDSTAVPASLTYHAHGVLFLAPKSTDVRLTGHQFPYVFRLTPDDRHMTEALQTYALSQNWTRVGILHARSEHGEAVSSRFLTAAANAKIVVPFTRSYFNTADYRTQDFRQMLAEIREFDFNAFAVAGELPWAAKLIKDMVQMGYRLPVMATDKLDSDRVIDYSEKAANDLLYVGSAVDRDSKEPRYVEFRDGFNAVHGSHPGYGSSQGYEALMLLANAIERSASADPVVVATTLKTNCWKSLFGEVSFDAKGDVVGRAISIKRLQNNQFRTVDAIPEVNREEEMKEMLAKGARTCLP
jgi:branched-chain amino acid transport system substrate-binding protein